MGIGQALPALPVPRGASPCAVSPDLARALTPWKSRRYVHDDERVMAGSLGRSRR